MDSAYRFDVYVLDPVRRELRRGSELLPLPQRSFDLLRYLLENASRVVQKQELLEVLWPGENISPSALPVAAWHIREAFGEGGSGEILKTVRGRGYRIACPVERQIPDLQPSTPHAARPGFVGRASVMAELDQHFREALKGDGSAILLSGEAGIGKTRVLDEFTRAARTCDAIVLQVRCPDDPGAPPFWPISCLMSEVDAILSSASFADRAGQRRFEQVQRRLAELFRGDGAEALEQEPGRLRVARTAMQWLTSLSAIAPVALVIDDLHCADAGSIQVFEEFLRELEVLPVFALLGARSLPRRREGGQSHPLHALLDLRSVRKIALTGLDRSAIAAFLRVETGQPAREGWADALFERTRGNPFFLRETVRLLIAKQEGEEPVNPTALGLPLGVREAVRRRMMGLSDACSQLLDWASVIGNEFSIQVLAQVLAQPPDELRLRLLEAQDAEIVAPVGGKTASGLETFCFVHSLIRETLYEELSGPERVLRHQKVAEALDVSFGMDRDHIFELAWHFFEAAPGGEIDRAVRTCLRAARHSRRRYAYESEVKQLERALRAEELRLPRDDTRYCSLVMARASALWRAGYYARAEEAFQHAAGVARALQRPDLLGYTVLGMVGWPRFNRLRSRTAVTDSDAARISRLAREALRGIGASNPALRSRLLGVLVRTNRGTVEEAQRREWASEAVELARASGDRRALFHSLMARMAALAGPRHVRAALALASEATELAVSLGASPRIFAAYEMRIPLLLSVGDVSAVDHDIEAASEIARHHRVPAYGYSVTRFQLARALGDGDLPRAHELLQKSRLLGEKAEDRRIGWSSRAIEFWIHAVQGQAQELSKALDWGSMVREARSGDTATAAYFCMLSGDTDHCSEYFESLAREDFAPLANEPSWLWYIATCADVCAYLKDRARAETLLDLLRPFRDLNVVNQLYCYFGSAAFPMARLCHLLGRREAAIELFEQALHFNTQLGAAPAVLSTKRAYARMLAEGDEQQCARARKLDQSARASALALGINLGRNVDVAGS